MGSKVFNGILMIAGTSIGGGMLALPIATAAGGFWPAAGLLLMGWALMTYTAFLTLEVNLWFPIGTNTITMARATLGPIGPVIGWSVYLLFLYALLAVYIAGGQDIVHGMLQIIGLHTPLWVDAVVVTGLLALVVGRGVSSAVLANRWLMKIKLLAFFLLLGFITPHFSFSHLPSGQLKLLLPAVTVVITSFGFSVIIPTLRCYLNDDVKQLRMTVFCGSLLPLVFYLLWVGVIFGVLPPQGADGLLAMNQSSTPITSLVNGLIRSHASYWIPYGAHIFTSICVLTAFICVAMGLFDYLADGLAKSNSTQKNIRWKITSLTFLPPLLIVLLYPKAFIMALGYAGLLCVLLQALMPTLMTWLGRYQQNHTGYRAWGGKIGLLLAIFGSLIVIIIGCWQLFFIR